MPYIGQRPSKGDENNFKILDDISSYTLTFDGSDSSVVSAANDTITLRNHRFIQGQRVTYNKGSGGTVITGLSDGVYYIIKDDHNTIKLATSASNASNGVIVNLTGVGGGSSHTLNVAFDGVNTKFKATHTNGVKAKITRSAQLVISINGVIQQPHDSATPSTGFGFDLDGTIVFSQAPVASDVYWAHLLTNNNVTFDISDNDVDNFTGDGSTTTFNLSKTPSDNRNVLVTIDGVVQYPSDSTTTRAYNVVENVLTFTTAPDSNVEIQVRHIGFAGSTSGGSSGGVTSFYGRTGAVVLTNTDNIVANNAEFAGNLTVQGTMTTLDTKVTEVDQLEVAANNTTVGVAITQSGTGDILNLYDSSTQVFTVDDEGNVTLSKNNPTISLSDSNNNPDYQIGNINGVLRFQDTTNNATRLGISTTGNVGMGHDSPDTLLHLQGDKPKLRIESTNVLEASAGTEEIGRIEFEAKKGSNINVAASLRVRQDGTWSTVDDWFSPTAIEFYTQDQSGTEITIPRVIIKSDGNVGIGTDNPAKKLEVFDATQGVMRIRGGGGGSDTSRKADLSLFASGAREYVVRADASDAAFKIVDVSGSNAERFVINSSGNIGIGSAIPSAKLDVVGTGIFSGLLTAENEILIKGAGTILELQAYGGPAIGLKDTNGNSFAFISNTGGTFHVATSSNSYSNKLSITSAGNVGINTSTVTTAQDRALTVYGTTGGELQLKAANFGGGGSGEGAALTWSYGSLFLTNNATNGDIHFSTKKSGESTTEKMRITESGLVGIGTGNPETILTIAKNATNQTVATIPTVRLTNLDTTAVATNIVGSYEFFSKDVHSNNKVTGFMRNTPTDAGVNYDLTFGTIKTGDSNAVEKLRIGSDGKVGIGTDLSSSTYKLEVWDDTAATFMIRKGNSSRIVFSNDSQTNTLYSQALPNYDARPFSVYMGSSEAIRIGVGGGVGIGTDYLSGNTAVYHKLMVEGDTTSQIAVAKILRRHSSASNGTYTLEVDSSSHTSNVANGGAMSVNVNSGRAFHIDGYGNVGINTSTALPTWCKLSINHGQYGLTQFSNHSHLVLQNKNAGTTDFWSLAPRDNGSISLTRGTLDVNGTVADSGSTFSISSAGRVGIGSVANSVSSFFEANYTSGTVAYPFETANNSEQSYSPYDHEVTIRNNTNGVENNFCGIFFRPGAHSDGNRISCARISAIETGDYRADLTFGTRGYRGGQIRYQEVMRLDSNGNASLKTGNLAFAAGAGIDFGAATDIGSGETVSNSILRDYEEGTFTPLLYYNGGTSQPTYSWRYGHYIKVGKQVTIWFALGIASFSGTSFSQAYIGGLPFQSNDPNGQWKYLNHMMGYEYASGWGDGGSDNHMFLAIYDNQTKMMINHEGNHLQTGNIGNSQRFSCTVTYQTD